MDYYFENREKLVEWMKINLKLDMDDEGGYYGDSTIRAKIMFGDTELMDETKYVSASNYIPYCDCGGAGV